MKKVFYNRRIILIIPNVIDVINLYFCCSVQLGVQTGAKEKTVSLFTNKSTHLFLPFWKTCYQYNIMTTTF